MTIMNPITGRAPRPKHVRRYPKTFGKNTPPAFGDTTPYMVMTREGEKRGIHL